MSVKNELLSQCLDLAKQLMKNNQKATINISVGTDFNFKFSNLEHARSFTEKYKSPIQKKRSLERKAQYDLKNLNNDKVSDANISPDLNKKKCEMKDYATQTKEEKIVKAKDSETQTDNEKQVKYKDSETQTLEPEISKLEFSVKSGQINVTIFSAKMGALKDLIQAEKLNSSALHLQLTAQSQTDTKKSRASLETEFAGRVKRARRE